MKTISYLFLILTLLDTFVSDDESLTIGKFIRADGKEMSVRKNK